MLSLALKNWNNKQFRLQWRRKQGGQGAVPDSLRCIDKNLIQNFKRCCDIISNYFICLICFGMRRCKAEDVLQLELINSFYLTHFFENKLP